LIRSAEAVKVIGLAESGSEVHDGMRSWIVEYSHWRLAVKRFAGLFALVLSLAWIPAVAADSSSINGWISDSMCAAKHAGTGAACAKKCIEGGSAPVFVDEAKKAVWSIDNPDAVKGFYGDHVTVQATADADKKSVHIDSIAEAK
jgi:hypothetical protein